MEQTNTKFLPVSKADMAERGWEEYDFLLITGDAYVDHPSFGSAIISRLLEREGYRVAILAQPDWRRPQSFTALGRPRLGVLISSGNIDSMVAHYTVAKKRRHDDAYSPGNRAGLRPDHAVVVYANRVREVFRDIPVIIGGLEASLRRFAHYDYWDDKVRRGVLFDSQADLLVYGMGERATKEIAARLASGTPVSDIRDVKGTAYIAKDPAECVYPKVEVASYEAVCADKRSYAEANMAEYREHDPIVGRAILQRHGGDLLVVNPPAMPLTTAELDAVAELPYVREPHPMYDALGGVPAIEEVRFSVAHNRGCFGACNFCSLAFHQGRIISARSHESVIREVTALTKHPGFKGYIHDVGGPTANFRRPACQKQMKAGLCKNRACLSPEACPNLDADHTDYLMLLRKLREIPGVKKVFIRSGIRYDFMMRDKSGEFCAELVKHHISGQLKVAPEHCVNGVLDYMGKPHIEVYEKFRHKYERLNQKYEKEQYLVPYLMSSHPGCTLEDAVRLAEWLNASGRQPEQVQDFYPTPGTLSTCMYYTGIDPRTMQQVFVPTDPHDKAMQRALMQWKRPEKRALVQEALRRAHREDLIGYGKGCLLRPNGGAPYAHRAGEKPAGRGKGGVGAKGRPSDRPDKRGKGDAPAGAGRPAPKRKAGWAAPKPKKNTRPGRGKKKL
ncbi:YgiQ family radical SAM protein [Pseudoflavonifractor phocaeensis]|uniref:YgiQ family radical SAM protein n=1 Tax=Pseudoflavonifractor phocaeensis TaxID=1870988 RepID=UPI0021089091|nr:YgiQ family radical SAM protein [Pseudoflavonifractor phocaeensis]MCQ4864981.1 YgiQ family radical SAM protein [Pseudoflavonifractor phocaeensis]